MARRISDEFRQELLDKTDIVDLISRYVPLKKKGSSYWACCPFHKEKTASLSVNMQKQLYYCFGCHKGGNAITFVKEIENMTYPEAVQLLADLAGMTIPDDGGFGNDEEREKRRKRHYEICKEAAKYFFSVLSAGENPAKAYCAKRGLIPAVIKRFGIGYAKGDGGLLKHLHKLGFTEEEMLESCLAKRDKNGKLKEFFFERLMFPIIDVYGNFIAFGGRVIGEGEPKYLNSSDSEFYNKKRHLYGLNIVKKQKTISRLILAEGYMDVVALSSYGLQGAVASLGTAFTKEQCMLIKRFTQNVFIAYDGDKAGQNAAVRAYKILIEGGVVPKILSFPGGLDPDEFLKKYGTDAFEDLIEGAVSPYKFEIDLLAKNYDLADESGRRDFTSEALKIVAAAQSELDKEDMQKYLSVKTGYSIETLVKQTKRFEKKDASKEDMRPKAKKAIEESAKTKAEAMAIKMALTKYRDEILISLGEDDFDNEAYRESFKAIKDGELSAENALFYFAENDEAKHQKLMRALITDDETINEISLDECISAIKDEKAKQELKTYETRLADTTDKEERLKILSKISDLQKQLKKKN